MMTVTGASKNNLNVTAYKKSPWLYVRTTKLNKNGGNIRKSLRHFWKNKKEVIDVIITHFNKCEIVIPQQIYLR